MEEVGEIRPRSEKSDRAPIPSTSKQHRLYRIPLFHQTRTGTDGHASAQSKDSPPYLLIFVPDPTWVTVEEALDDMGSCSNTTESTLRRNALKPL